MLGIGTLGEVLGLAIAMVPNGPNAQSHDGLSNSHELLKQRGNTDQGLADPTLPRYTVKN